jgi:hypothetical protein
MSKPQPTQPTKTTSEPHHAPAAAHHKHYRFYWEEFDKTHNGIIFFKTF